MRTERFVHNINLPGALYFAGYDEARPSERRFALQLLGDVESFAAAFEGTPGVKKVLKPLWTAPWDKNDPAMWSVVAHAWMSTRLRSVGANILAFEAPTGTRNRTADIQFRHKEQDYLLDLEMWNAATGATAEAIREKGMRRAETKAAEKFAYLPPRTTGIVAEICFAGDEPFEQIVNKNNQHILSVSRLSERCSWLLSMICYTADTNGQIEGYFFAYSQD